MAAYYNELDPVAAEWLRELICAGAIADGVVDNRSISDVEPYDLKEFRQCHFFAGIGVWSYALRQAGWPDDRPVWTGSCPCQPFSLAGRGGGFADERHLWPHWFHLITECQPDAVFGEQVASKDGLGWLDLVQTDLEGAGYASGAVDLCAAGVGAPHIRQRLFFVAERLAHPTGKRHQRTEDAGREAQLRFEHTGGSGGLGNNNSKGLEGFGLRYQTESRRDGEIRPVAETGQPGGLANNDRAGLRSGCERGETLGYRQTAESDSGVGRLANNTNFRQYRRRSSEARNGGDQTRQQSERFCDVGRLAHSDGPNPEQFAGARAGSGKTDSPRPCGESDGRSELVEGQPQPGPTNGLWGSVDWLLCRDGKWRPVEPGTFPLAHGAPARVGRLRGYGNAIVAEVARTFISAYMETQEQPQ